MAHDLIESGFNGSTDLERNHRPPGAASPRLCLSPEGTSGQGLASRRRMRGTMAPAESALSRYLQHLSERVNSTILAAQSDLGAESPCLNGSGRTLGKDGPGEFIGGEFDKPSPGSQSPPAVLSPMIMTVVARYCSARDHTRVDRIRSGPNECRYRRHDVGEVMNNGLDDADDGLPRSCRPDV